MMNRSSLWLRVHAWRSSTARPRPSPPTTCWPPTPTRRPTASDMTSSYNRKSVDWGDATRRKDHGWRCSVRPTLTTDASSSFTTSATGREHSSSRLYDATSSDDNHLLELFKKCCSLHHCNGRGFYFIHLQTQTLEDFGVFRFRWQFGLCRLWIIQDYLPIGNKPGH